MSREAEPPAPREPKIRIIEELPPEPEEEPEPRPEPYRPPSAPDQPALSRAEGTIPAEGIEVEGLKGYTAGPFQYEDSSVPSSSGPEIPPVTLGLLKQSILFDTELEALRYTERLLNVDRPEAQNTIRSILRDHPGMRPSSQ